MGIVYFSVNGAGGGGGGSMPVNTSNGLSGDGSAGNPVVLGGTLETMTNIDVDSKVLTFFGTDGSGNNLNFVIGQGQFKADVSSADGTSAHLDVEDNGLGGAFAGLNLSGGSGAVGQNTVALIGGSVVVENNLVYPGTGNVVGIQIFEGTPGIIISDQQDNQGLVGDVLFPVSGSPNQYAQYGNLTNNQVAKVDSLGLAATTVIPLYNLPIANNQMLEILVYCAVQTAGAGNININVTFTDKFGNPGSFNIGSKAGTGSMQTTPVIIDAQAGSPVAISVVVSSIGFVFDVGAVANLQFNN